MSAHSPLIVAGSLEREVAVLRKRTDGFAVEQEDVAFVGASARKLYEEVFDIREIDDSLRLHPSWKRMDEADVQRIRELEIMKEGRKLIANERLELASLKREARVRLLADEALGEREDERQANLELKAEIERLKDRIRDLGGDDTESPDEHA